jgi:tripartite-type tricarboxylate transporter receptor subunit TctC
MAETFRSRAVPEIPTIAESGVPGFGRAGGFIGLFAPAGTPADVVKRLSAEVRDILATPAVRASAKTLSVSTDYLDDAAFAKFLATEGARWKQTLHSLKLSQ